MKLDEIHNRIEKHREKKAENIEEQGYLTDDLEKMEALLAEAAGTDTGVFGALETVLNVHEKEKQRADRDTEELEEEKQEIRSDTLEEKEKNSAAGEKLESLKDSRYKGSIETAAQKQQALKKMIDSILAELEDDGSPGTVVGLEGKTEPNSRVVVDGRDYMTDDNGSIYMEREEDGQFRPMPDRHYQSRGYSYVTDEKGRIVHAEGRLRLKDGERKPLNAVVADMQAGDQRGHIVGDQFDGSNKNDNLAAQLGTVNQGAYKALENSLAVLVRNGHEVQARFELLYADDTRRPSCTTVGYSVDGDDEITVDFLNY